MLGSADATCLLELTRRIDMAHVARVSLFLSVIIVCLVGIYLQACKGIYMKRENDDLQKAEKLVHNLQYSLYTMRPRSERRGI